MSDANAPDVFGLMTILRLRRVSISSVSFSICRKLWSGKFCSSGVGFSMAVPRKEFYKNCPGNCPEKNVPTRLFRQDKSASRGHETSSGFIVNQLWNGAKVNACMLIAVGLETLFTSVVAVVALAIWFEWMYLREERQRNQPPPTDSQSLSKSDPC